MTKQEDRFTFKEKFQGNEINAFYAVFDGHAGYQAAHFCKENLPKKLERIEITKIEQNITE